MEIRGCPTPLAFLFSPRLSAPSAVNLLWKISMTPIILLGLALAAPPAEGLRVPDGFEVTEYSGSDLANDITCMTLDPKGRIVVAGRSYIRVLTGDKDGRATRAIDVTQ